MLAKPYPQVIFSWRCEPMATETDTASSTDTTSLEIKKAPGRGERPGAYPEVTSRLESYLQGCNRNHIVRHTPFSGLVDVVITHRYDET